MSIVLQGSTSGSITLQEPAVAGSSTYNLVAATGTLAPLIAGTAQASTSGTNIDFTGIPSWVKRITIMFVGVSTNGTSGFGIQLGDAGGIETSGYLGAASRIVNATAASIGNLTSQFNFVPNSATALCDGTFCINLVDSNTWTGSGMIGVNNALTTLYCAGTKSLSDTLTQVRIMTLNGTDTFDAGTINILYE